MGFLKKAIICKVGTRVELHVALQANASTIHFDEKNAIKIIESKKGKIRNSGRIAGMREICNVSEEISLCGIGAGSR